jgi:hypothetical protein
MNSQTDFVNFKAVLAQIFMRRTGFSVNTEKSLNGAFHKDVEHVQKLADSHVRLPASFTYDIFFN